MKNRYVEVLLVGGVVTAIVVEDCSRLWHSEHPYDLTRRQIDPFSPHSPHRDPDGAVTIEPRGAITSVTSSTAFGG